MIKVGIAGADTQLGGELLRLLAHHPEVELVSLFAPSLKGRSVASFHKGLTGETNVKFSDTLNLENLDVLFLLSGWMPADITNSEDLKLISFKRFAGRIQFPGIDTINFVPGLSEMFRKPLVRGAVAAQIPLPPVSVALIALYPLASHLLLNDELEININLPQISKDKYSGEEIKEDLEGFLRDVQLSFQNVKNIEIHTSSTIRALTVEITFPCGVSETEIEKLFDDIYDDHNFTHIVHNEPDPVEVSGTQKCLIYITKPSEDRLKIKAVADGILRGGAGDAIHVMNLLFGLFEKTGLNLQASLAFRSNHENNS